MEGLPADDLDKRRAQLRAMVSHRAGGRADRSVGFVHQVDYALRLGFLRAGDQLPRIKDMTRSLAVSPDTVMKAYRELELRGITAGRPGVGTFITRAPDVVGLKQMATLQKKLTTWLAEAAEAGVDELGMKARIQYRPALTGGFLAQTGLTLEPGPPQLDR